MSQHNTLSWAKLAFLATTMLPSFCLAAEAPKAVVEKRKAACTHEEPEQAFKVVSNWASQAKSQEERDKIIEANVELTPEGPFLHHYDPHKGVVMVVHHYLTPEQFKALVPNEEDFKRIFINKNISYKDCLEAAGLNYPEKK